MERRAKVFRYIVSRSRGVRPPIKGQHGENEGHGSPCPFKYYLCHMPLRQLQHSETPPRFPTLNALVTVDNVHFVNFSSVHFRWRMAKDTVEGGTRSGLFDFSKGCGVLKEMVKLFNSEPEKGT